METNVFKPTVCLGGESTGWFSLVLLFTSRSSIRVYGSCRARGIANILLIISLFLSVHPCLHLVLSYYVIAIVYSDLYVIYYFVFLLFSI
jgi:uncharacterized membrane protein YhdT